MLEFKKITFCRQFARCGKISHGVGMCFRLALCLRFRHAGFLQLFKLSKRVKSCAAHIPSNIKRIPIPDVHGKAGRRSTILGKRADVRNFAPLFMRKSTNFCERA
jgi:hypothetical protein